MKSISFGLIGVGRQAAYVHHPAIKLARGARVVAMADTRRELLAQRAKQWRGVAAYDDPLEIFAHDGLDAVVICTANNTHAPLVLAALRARKHVLCEKPLALTLAEARAILAAAVKARRRHMTAFTYRFVPAMKYLKQLVVRGDLGVPRHFRAQRFQDWPDTAIGWRQWRATAGTGELGDMASHRIDYARFLLGEIKAVCGAMKQFVPRDRDARGKRVRPSDTDDWCAFVGEFACGATGVWESTKLARGHGSGGRSHDFVEINGVEASAIYELRHPYRLLIGKRGGTFKVVPVPRRFLKHPQSSRKAGAGDPMRVWRYDQAVEFIEAIREGRDASPSFADGLAAQAVIDAVLRSVAERRWIDVPRT